MARGPLRIVTALPAEARPIVARFDLRRDPDATGFVVYRDDETRGEDVALVVSRPGKVAAAAAVAYLHLAAGGERDAVWLDVGVAGHRERALGDVVLANRVVDRASGESFYPPQLARPFLPGAEVLTVDVVERGYQGDWVYDMEASGFCATAARFASAELVQVLKVVSDNPTAPPDERNRVDKGRIAALVETALDPLERLADELAPLAAELRALAATPPDYDELTSSLRFTVAERRILERLLRRRRALAPELPLPPDLAAGCRRGKDLVRRLEAWLDALPVDRV